MVATSVIDSTTGASNDGATPGDVAHTTGLARFGYEIALAIAATCWIVAIVDADPLDMGGLGLLSVLGPWLLVSLALTSGGFLLLVHRHGDRRPLLGAYVVALITVLHATPTLVSGTLTGAWPWRHLGAADVVRQTGTVDPESLVVGGAHAWPGQAALTALVTDVTGFDAVTIARWTPVVLALVTTLAFAALVESLVAEPRVRWLAIWIFVCANWVGQEHLSPQGVAFALYLATLAIAIPLERRAESDAMIGKGLGPAVPSALSQRLLRVVVLGLLVAIVATHQLTPLVMIVTFGALAWVGATRTAWVAIATAALVLLWLRGPAWPFFENEAFGVAETIGAGAENSFDTWVDTGRVDDSHRLAIIAGRFLTQGVIVLGVIGLFTHRVSSTQRRVLAIGIVSPMVIVFTDIGMDTVMRAYLFATPWLAVGAAMTLTGRRRSNNELIGRAAVVCVTVLATVIASFGTGRADHFTDDEVDAVTRLFEGAPDGALLIEGTRNYPGRSIDPERFTYAPLDLNSAPALARLEADPEAELLARIDGADVTAGYVVITRSMKAAEQNVASLPDGLLQRVEDALADSSAFDPVVQTRDAVVFAVLSQGGNR